MGGQLARYQLLLRRKWSQIEKKKKKKRFIMGKTEIGKGGAGEQKASQARKANSSLRSKQDQRSFETRTKKNNSGKTKF